MQKWVKFLLFSFLGLIMWISAYVLQTGIRYRSRPKIPPQASGHFGSVGNGCLVAEAGLKNTNLRRDVFLADKLAPRSQTILAITSSGMAGGPNLRFSISSDGKVILASEKSPTGFLTWNATATELASYNELAKRLEKVKAEDFGKNISGTTDLGFTTFQFTRANGTTGSVRAEGHIADDYSFMPSRERQHFCKAPMAVIDTYYKALSASNAHAKEWLPRDIELTLRPTSGHESESIETYDPHVPPPITHLKNGTLISKTSDWNRNDLIKFSNIKAKHVWFIVDRKPFEATLKRVGY